MPTDEENVKFLWMVLTAGGMPSIDFDAMSAELNLKKGATSMRWTRLKKAIEKGKPPGPAAHQFLWLAVKNSTRVKSPDWKVIADACNIKPGAASMRFTRLKKAMETGAAAPGAGTGAGESGEATTSKRKRVTDNAEGDAPQSIEPDSLSEDKSVHDAVLDEPVPTPKRRKAAAKPKATLKTKVPPPPKAPKATKASKTSQVKEEVSDHANLGQDVEGHEFGIEQEYSYTGTSFENDTLAGSKVYNDRGWDTAPEVEDYDVFAGYDGYSGFRHSSANTGEQQVDDEVA